LEHVFFLFSAFPPIDASKPKLLKLDYPIHENEVGFLKPASGNTIVDRPSSG
jgi:hypothetical protein